MLFNSNQVRITHRISSYAILKGVNIAFGLVSGFYVPYVLVRSCSNNTAALMLTYFGLSSFFLLLDFGITRPIFNLLKISIEKNKALSFIFPVFISIFFIILIAVNITFFLYKYVYSSNLENLVILCYALAVSAATLISMLKPVLAALDKYIYFERIEIIRRFGTIAGFTILLFFNNIFLAVLVMLLINISCLMTVLRASDKITFNLNLFEAFAYFRKNIGQDARNNWRFTLSELVVYNYGYYIMPFITSDEFMISYGIYMRFLTGMYMAIRFYPDTLIWKLVDCDKSTMFRRVMIRNLVFSAIVISGYIIFSNRIVSIIYGVDYVSQILCVYVALYAIGNTIRHLPGGLLTYKYRMYKWVSNVSMAECLSVLFLTGLLIMTEYRFIILAFSISYLLFSSWIVNRVYRLI